MTNDEKIAIALKSDYLSELSVFETLPNSRIRPGFDRRMKKMISELYTDTVCGAKGRTDRGERGCGYRAAASCGAGADSQLGELRQ